VDLLTDFTLVGHLDVHAGTKVYFNDSTIFGKNVSYAPERPTAVPITFYLKALEDEHLLFNDANPETSHMNLSAKAWTSSFGLDPRDAYLGSAQIVDPLSPGFSRRGSRLIFFPENSYGCNPFLDPTGGIDGSMVLVKRGGCYFIEKLANARQAGAAGAIVWQEEDEQIHPSAEREDLQRLSEIIEGAMLLVIGSDEAAQIGSMLRFEDAHPGKVEVWVQLDDRWMDDMDLFGVQGVWPPDQPTKTESTVGRMLYVNGHALVNTVLLF
jgi:mannosidase alpha-like ER degradation enhancer 1